MRRARCYPTKAALKRDDELWHAGKCDGLRGEKRRHDSCAYEAGYKFGSKVRAESLLDSLDDEIRWLTS